jgi:23S rRNA G2445 N2-methylase RlmL
MTQKRASDFDLRVAIRDPGFTPRAADADALLDLLPEDQDDAPWAERALCRLGLLAEDAALARIGSAAEDIPSRLHGRLKLLRLLARVCSGSSNPVLVARLGECLTDDDERVRRGAAVALGKLRPPGAEPLLVAALGREVQPSARRAMILGLGKVGTEMARSVLLEQPPNDGEVREATRASMMVARTLLRRTPSRVLLDHMPAFPLRVLLHCRAGIEPVLKDELCAIPSLRHVRKARNRAGLEGLLEGPLCDLLRARTLLRFGLVLDPVSGSRDSDDAVATALASPQALSILRELTEGPLRYRLDFRRSGKRRASVWRVATETMGRAPELVNDPTESPWEALVDETDRGIEIELVPTVDDTRFAYRRGDVPAASHPTIAAALARVTGTDPGDVVWDPFVGSGLELCERALLGPYRALVGSDRSPAALEVAGSNLKNARAHDVTLLVGDACSVIPPGPRPTVIVTNPPLGRRVERGRELAYVLEQFILHAAGVLGPGGRLVWMSPFPERTRAAAEQHGFVLTSRRDVDMGGFAAQMQQLVRVRRR